MTKLILIRHGESVWNKKNLFTGWVDVPMTENGVEESIKAGKKIADIPLDLIYTSTLIRAQMTIPFVMMQHKSKKTPVFKHLENKKQHEWEKIYSEETLAGLIPVYTAWELNERMYGELQGLNKDETREKFGKEQVHIWRRSFDTAPPSGESLKMTSERAIPYFEKEIVPHLQKGKNVLISAHGNSLRAIIMFMEGLSKEEVVSLEIPTGDPLVYNFENGKYDLSR